MNSSLIFALLACFAFCGARHVTEGELEKVLRDVGADMRYINTWKCIVNAESHYETNAYNAQTGDYGIFQISHLYWCDKGPNVGCGISCASLMDDDIYNDARCAVLIYNDAVARWGDGFKPWTTEHLCK